MRKYFGLGIVLLFTACSKKDSSIPSTYSATVNVINAVVNNTGIKVNTNNSPIVYLSANQVGYGAASLYYIPRSQGRISLVTTADTTNYLLNSTYSFNSGFATIYLAGQTGAIDTIAREETNYPFIRTDVVVPDSSIYLRYVNLSPNSTPVNINIKGAGTNEANSLAYKGITDFKKYPALASNGSYIFEVRDVVTNTLLTTYTFTVTATNRFKNVALIIKGLTGTTTGTNAFGVFTANYF